MSAISRSNFSAKTCAPVSASINYTGGADALASRPNAAFEHEIRTELSPNLRRVYRLPFVAERGVPSYDGKILESAQLGADVFRNAVGEIVLFRVSRHVCEGQNGDGGKLPNAIKCFIEECRAVSILKVLTGATTFLSCTSPRSFIVIEILPRTHCGPFRTGRCRPAQQALPAGLQYRPPRHRYLSLHRSHRGY